MRQTIHTPEGVRDIYGNECEKKQHILSRMKGQFFLYGYKEIQTPTFEFDNVFDQDESGLSTSELYKFFDREGRILTLRPDMTPGVVRAAATVCDDTDFPVRLCYSGSIFLNHNSYQGRPKEQTQLGAELLGAESVEADAEMIAMLIDCLKKAGLSDFQVAIGHVDFLQGLVDDTKLDREAKDEIYTLIANRNYFGVEEILTAAHVRSSVLRAFSILPSLVGGVEIMELAAGAAGSIRSKLAIGRLLKIYKFLDSYGLGRHVTFDLSMNGTYGYYTGIIFRAYTYGTGDAVAKGGRYDHLPEKFGLQIPAIGFAVTVDELLLAMTRQETEIPLCELHLLVYEEDQTALAIRLAARFRSGGRRICMVRREEFYDDEFYKKYAAKQNALSILFLRPDQMIDMYNLKTEESVRRKV